MASKLVFLLVIVITIASTSTSTSTSTSSMSQIQSGFSASPVVDAASSPQFQAVLTDATSNFALGFLPVNSSQLDLAVIHIPSSFPLWRATPIPAASWSSSTSLSFDGTTLLLSDPKAGLKYWCTTTTATATATANNLLILDSSSNLQIVANNSTALWQSFDHPSDTIVQDQNFTSTTTLAAADQSFSMSFGPDYSLALYMDIQARPMYWKHSIMQEKAQIVPGGGPIYARVDPTGFLGFYQAEALIEVISFDTFNAGIKRSLRRLTLESDGNLKAYYWSGSGWVSDYAAISDTCDLPAPCGPYGMCQVEGQRCGGCLGNRTAGSSSSSSSSSCFAQAVDLCGSGSYSHKDVGVLRRTGVDLANKELIGFKRVGSLAECEGLCADNCSCWGAMYNNASGYCYPIDYPIQTLLQVSNSRKSGYFKFVVTASDSASASGVGNKRREALIIAGALSLLLLLAGFVGYRVWNARRWRRRSFGEDDSGMPYKDLTSTSSGSIELSHSFNKT